MLEVGILILGLEETMEGLSLKRERLNAGEYAERVSLFGCHDVTRTQIDIRLPFCFLFWGCFESQNS